MKRLRYERHLKSQALSARYCANGFALQLWSDSGVGLFVLVNY